VGFQGNGDCGTPVSGDSGPLALGYGAGSAHPGKLDDQKLALDRLHAALCESCNNLASAQSRADLLCGQRCGPSVRRSASCAEYQMGQWGQCHVGPGNGCRGAHCRYRVAAPAGGRLTRIHTRRDRDFLLMV